MSGNGSGERIEAESQPATARASPARGRDPDPKREQERERGRERSPDVTDHHTNHWAGIVGVALLLGALGVIVREPGLVLASVVGVVFAGYAETARPVRIHDEDGEPTIEIRRRLSPDSAEPGEEVTVTVAVRNVGDRFLPDVRVVDGVPAELEVVDGTPRHGAPLGPGRNSTFEYAVAATRGEHEWQPAVVTVADPSGSIERETTVACETTLRCRLSALETDQLPLRGLTTPYAGRVETDSGGSGVEFYATREYRPNDPLSRVDWYRRARTGELGTLEFREERAATVGLVIDTRRASYRAPNPGDYHAVERSVDAATRIFTALLDSGDRVGLATFGPREECWLSPGTGAEHRARGLEVLNTHPSLSPIPPDRERYEGYRPDRREELRRRRIAHLHRRLPPDAQVFFCSPCCDEYAATVARRLDAYGRHVTVISPDPTTDETPLTELARMEREDRIAALRRAELRVIDWAPDESFVAALARAKTRWSA